MADDVQAGVEDINSEMNHSITQPLIFTKFSDSHELSHMTGSKLNGQIRTFAVLCDFREKIHQISTALFYHLRFLPATYCTVKWWVLQFLNRSIIIDQSIHLIHYLLYTACPRKVMLQMQCQLTEGVGRYTLDKPPVCHRVVIVLR